MTKAELIKALEPYPDDMEVYIDESYQESPVVTVRVKEDLYGGFNMPNVTGILLS